MKRYKVYFNVSGCIVNEVEAENEIEAIEVAYCALDDIDLNECDFNWEEDIEEVE